MSVADADRSRFGGVQLQRQLHQDPARRRFAGRPPPAYGDQLFYILSGTMSLEIEGKRYEAGPGTLVVFPAGTPCRNWNGGREATVHLAINSPLPHPALPFAQAID